MTPCTCDSPLCKDPTCKRLGELRIAWRVITELYAQRQHTGAGTVEAILGDIETECEILVK